MTFVARMYIYIIKKKSCIFLIALTVVASNRIFNIIAPFIQISFETIVKGVHAFA